MRSIKPTKQTETVAFRLSKSELELLDFVAEATGRSRSNTIKHALSRYLTVEKRLLEAEQNTLQEWRVTEALKKGNVKTQIQNTIEKQKALVTAAGEDAETKPKQNPKGG